MKPDGKIQGVDVWVRDYAGRKDEWCIADSLNQGTTKLLLNRDDADAKLRSREAALAHLRKLEAKERPMIDLTTAKFGDKFKRGDGKIETYACPQEGEPDWHVMQSGETYSTNGSYVDRPNDERNLIAPYVEPRTREVWLEWYSDRSGREYVINHASKEDFDNDHITGCVTIALKRVTLTEGEGLTQPDEV